jgi:hypothetical protein
MRLIERRPGFFLIAVTLAIAVAAPVVIGADPSSSPTASAKPGRSPLPSRAPKADKAPKPDKSEKGPEIAITLNGTVATSTDGKGRSSFTLTSGGTVYELSAGPKWFWGKNNPLAAYVGKSVKVVGSHTQGSTDVDVDLVDGKALRAEGRPPWAGGPRVVGEKHPGWKAWKAAGEHGNGKGRAGAPGQLKDKTKDDTEAPEASERPG